MALFYYRLSSKSNQLNGCTQLMLQQVRSYSKSKVAPPPSPPKALKGDIGIFRNEKITIDPEDPAAVSHYAKVMKQVRQKAKKGMTLLTAEFDKINNNLPKTKLGQINNQRVANEILDGGCNETVLLGLTLSTDSHDSVNFECYDIGMESTRKREKVSDYPVLFKSPPRASTESSMIVVGKHIYLVGGTRYTGVPLHPKKEKLSDVFCIDTTQPENGWVEKAHLPTPRSSPLLVSLDDNNLYCIGGGEEAPWAQLYHIKDDTWSELDVQPTGRCVELPYYVGWCALITEEKRKKIVLYGDDDRKLYCFDPDKETCDVYDECLINGFTNVLANLRKCSSNDGLVIPEDEYGIFSNKPAQDGDFVYFTGEFSIYCYHLLKKKWIPQLMHGFDRSTNVIPSPRPTTHLDDMWGAWRPQCMMVSLGRGEFCLIWISSTYEYMYWTRFGVDVRRGTPTASRFCATRKIRLPPFMWFGDIKCFAIQRRATNNPPPPSGTSDEKKKNKKKIDATSPDEKKKKNKKKIDATPLLM